jgi:hypothetical protein
MRELVQVISIIRFPLQEIDKQTTFTEQRTRVNGLSISRINPSDLRILRDAGTSITTVLKAVMQHNPVPYLKHGPGVVSETSDMLKKREVRFCSESLKDFSHFLPFLDPIWVPGVSRTIIVPKDHKSLRTIAGEPAWTQWIQQGYMKIMMRVIERHPSFRNRITFDDQTRQHALLKGRVATIDLSDASDSIRWKHMLLLGLPLDVRSWLANLRTPMTRFRGRFYPTIGVFPMGAALCFPFETLFFASLVVAWSRAETGQAPPTWGVFGDDIIITDSLYGGFCAFLRRIGLSPNMSKSFCGCGFLETCGLYLYKGVDITPVKIKKPPPELDSDETNLTYMEYADRLDRYTYHHLAQFLRSHVKYPFGATRWNRDYQRQEYRSLSFKSMCKKNTFYTYPEALISGTGQVSYGGITPSHDWLPIKVGR